MIIDYKVILDRLLDEYIENQEITDHNKKIVEKLNEWKVQELRENTNI